MKTKYKIFLILFSIILTLVVLEVCLCIFSSFYLKSNLPAYNAYKLDKEAYRIVCLGDSYTYGTGAGFEHSYPAQLEDMLNKRQKGIKFQVFNLGVPGYNSEQVKQRLKKSIIKLKPDSVIVITGDNDPWNFALTEKKVTLLGLKTKAILSGLRIYRLFAKLTADTTFKDDGMDVNKLILYGNKCRANLHFKKAEEYYKKVLEKEPNNTVGLLELARCYKLNGEFNKATNILKSAIRLDSNNVEIWGELDDLVIHQNKAEEKVKLFASLLQEFPDNKHFREQLANSYVDLALNFLKKNQIKKAEITYKHALKLDPNARRAYGVSNLIEICRANPEKVPSALFLHPGTRWMSLWQRYLFNQRYILRKAVDQILFTNLVEITKICKKQKITLILSGYPHYTPKSLKKVADIYDLTLINHKPIFYDLLKTNPYIKYFASESDRHCNREGYRIMAKNIEEKI